jgi:hypothetical protein
LPIEGRSPGPALYPSVIEKGGCQQPQAFDMPSQQARSVPLQKPNIFESAHIELVPSQVSARSQGPAAARHEVPAGLNLSAGQVTLVPLHFSSASQGFGAARQVIVDATVLHIPLVLAPLATLHA